MPKADKIESDARVRQIMEWILAGNLSTDIISSCRKKWGIAERQAYKYLGFAREEIKTVQLKEFEDRRAFHLAARMKLFRNVEGKTDAYNASVSLQILQDMAKLDGVYPEKKAKPIAPEIPTVPNQVVKVSLNL